MGPGDANSFHGRRDDDDDDEREPSGGIAFNVGLDSFGGWLFFTTLLVLVFRCNGVALW